jgi:uncharacterized GH25 family protein
MLRSTTLTTWLWIGVCTTLAAGTGAALAHDFWIRPAAFTAKPGETLRASLLVGEQMKGESRPLRKDRVNEFVILGPEKNALSRTTESQDGADPAGTFSTSTPGLHVISFEGKENVITLAPDEFKSYLIEEGLEHIIEDRAARGESQLPGREAYARCAKSLVRIGDSIEGPWAALRSPRLELVPVRNPLALKAGEPLALKVLHAGNPLANAKVVARREQDPARTVSVRTDTGGLATLPLDGSGVWLITSVHMERAAGRSDVDWLSLWASLTFEITPTDAVPTASPSSTPPAPATPPLTPTTPSAPKPEPR